MKNINLPAIILSITLLMQGYYHDQLMRYHEKEMLLTKTIIHDLTKKIEEIETNLNVISKVESIPIDQVSNFSGWIFPTIIVAGVLLCTFIYTEHLTLQYFNVVNQNIINSNENINALINSNFRQSRQYFDVLNQNIGITSDNVSTLVTTNFQQSTRSLYASLDYLMRFCMKMEDNYPFPKSRNEPFSNTENGPNLDLTSNRVEHLDPKSPEEMIEMTNNLAAQMEVCLDIIKYCNT